jgi:hypothetical protein
VRNDEQRHSVFLEVRHVQTDGSLLLHPSRYSRLTLLDVITLGQDIIDYINHMIQ